MNNPISLVELYPGQKAVIESIRAKNEILRRLLEIGLIEGTEIECKFKSPLGDPTAFLIRGAVIAIRNDDCKDITARVIKWD